MKGRVAVTVVLTVLLVMGGLIYREHKTKPVPRPPLWGFHDPPVLINMSWEKLGEVEILTITSENASGLYGKAMQQLQDIGYSMTQGNWSELTCQWSLWESKNKTYYLAYNGSKFLAVRGPYDGVMKATKKTWLCGRPKNGTITSSPSPWKAAEALALSIGSEFMKKNVTISPSNWTGPLPDWYLAKFSFSVKLGKGVEVLILIYSNESEVKYAEYLMEKREKLRFLESDAGQYKALIVFKGRAEDVDEVLSILEGPEVRG
ncbi:hypothetical protein [Thermococcus sp.]